MDRFHCSNEITDNCIVSAGTPEGYAEIWRKVGEQVGNEVRSGIRRRIAIMLSVWSEDARSSDNGYWETLLQIDIERAALSSSKGKRVNILR